MIAQKLAVARCQLGTATQLFIDDKDPVSVQVLACCASEILDAISPRPFRDHALAIHTDLTDRDYKRLRSFYSNAFKHFTSFSGSPRDDSYIFSKFDDSRNDHALFVAWYDYGSCSGKLPLAAQVFQVWYYAMYPQRLSQQSAEAQALFPGISTRDRAAQKAMLRHVYGAYRNDPALLAASATETAPLICGREDWAI